jgi:urease accessory protein
LLIADRGRQPRWHSLTGAVAWSFNSEEMQTELPAVALNIHHVLGSRLEPPFSERIHRLELHDAVDEVKLSAHALDQRELRVTTRRGEELAIALPLHERLFDGAILLLDDDHAIVVREAGRRCLRLQPRSISDAIELGYHIGNLGWPVRFEGDVLFVAMQGRAENYVVRLGELIWSRRVGISVLDETLGG